MTTIEEIFLSVKKMLNNVSRIFRNSGIAMEGTPLPPIQAVKGQNRELNMTTLVFAR